MCTLGTRITVCTTDVTGCGSLMLRSRGAKGVIYKVPTSRTSECCRVTCRTTGRVVGSRGCRLTQSFSAGSLDRGFEGVFLGIRPSGGGRIVVDHSCSCPSLICHFSISHLP